MSFSYLPKNKSLYLVFDMSNGHSPARRYVWWFDSRQAARDFIKEHNKRPNASTLSAPVMYQKSPTTIKDF